MGKIKTLFFALMFTIFCIFTACERDKVTIEWDPVTTLKDGTTLPEGSTIEYELFISRKRSGERELLGTTEALSLTVPPPSGGPYLVGIRAKLVKVSDIVWSDDPTICKEGGNISCTLP